MNSAGEFRGATLVSSAVNGDVTFSQWSSDIVFKAGVNVTLNQIAVRRWKDGKPA